MKKTGKCPKCGNEDLLVVQGERRGHDYGANILTGWWANAQIDRFICRHCGYLEHWAHDARAIEMIAECYGPSMP